MEKRSAKPGGKRERPLSESERAFLNAIGEAVKARRFTKEITAESLGRMIGITGATQFRREAGDASFPVEDLHRYATALECSPRDLLPQSASKAAAHASGNRPRKSERERQDSQSEAASEGESRE